MIDIPKSATVYAVTSGLCACCGSIFGKLSGMSEQRFLQIIFFVLMIISNATVWTFFVKALQYSRSSLTATVISVATNYFCSVFIGFLLFDEVTSILWWCGTILVLIGLVMITRAKETEETKKTHMS